MNAWMESLTTNLLRTTLATGGAALAVMILLAALRIRSPRVHRLVWVLVVLQGWLFASFTWKIEVDRTLATSVPAVPVEVILPSTPAGQLAVLPAPASMEEFDAADVSRRVVLVAWAVGAVALAAIAMARYVRLFANGKLGEAPDNREWLGEWEKVCGCKPLPFQAELRTTRRLGPLVCWVPKMYLVLVPRSLWSRLDASDRRAILRHELAHCERGDLWKNLIVRMLALPQWFNPFARLAVRRFEEAGEWACDEQVARTSGETSTEYASTLLRVADFAASVPCGAVGATGGELTRRVKRLLHSPDKEVREMRGFILPAVLVAVSVLQAVRIERVVAEPPAAPAPVLRPAAVEAAAVETKALVAAAPKSNWSFDQPYVVEPPDILLVEGVRLVPKSPHKLETFDALLIRASGTLSDQPIDDAYSVDADGSVNLGPSYGRINVRNLTIDEAEDEIRRQLSQKLSDVEVSISLAQSAGAQQVTGQHLVGPDGRVNLGTYGSVFVAGLTIEETKKAVEDQLARKLEDPEVLVDVLAYNSKLYYVITQGGSFGDNVKRLPITGNETVLDAISQVENISLSSTRIWIARPAPNGIGCEQIVPVNITEIAKGKEAATNYRLLPGDRVFVKHTALETVKLPPKAATIRLQEEQTEVKLSLVTDPKANLRSIDGLKDGSSVVGDSQLLEGLLDMLARNGLSEVLASPTIVASNGQPAKLQLGSDEATPHRLIDIELRNRHSGNQVVFEARAEVKLGERQGDLETAFALTEGQSCLIRLLKEESDREAEDMYLLVTREPSE